MAVDLDDRDRDARILLAAPLARADLLAHFARQLVQRDEVAWDARAEAVVARRTLRLGELVVDDKPLPEIPAGAPRPPRSSKGCARSAPPRCRGTTTAATSRRAASSCARSDAPISAAWPDFSDGALHRDLAWLEPFLDGVTRRSHLDARAADRRRCARA